MAPRSELNDALKLICSNVYFQPPANVQMQYPAIVYQRSDSETTYADNIPYSHIIEYDVTLISRNPDEPIYHALAALPLCRKSRFFVVDNLNHDVFTLYF